MTTIQDRIIKQLDNNKNLFDWQKPELKQFFIQSIKLVEEETRKEILKVIKENHTIEVNNHSDLHLIGNFSGLKHNLSITNKEKQK